MRHSVPGLALRLLLAAVAALAAPAAAQSPFSAAVQINDRVVTYYEIEQRVRFLEVLNAPGDLRARAVESLVDERLQVDAALAAGITLAPEDLQQGLEDFAARADLSVDDFIAALEQEGIDAQTLRDFVRNGLVWRDLVRERFGPRARIAEAEVDRALALAAGQGDARVVLAEIFIPLTPQTEQEARALAQRLSSRYDGDTAGFSAAAREYSAAQTGQGGGVLPARPLSEIPPGLRQLILPLGPGDTTGPVPVGPALAIFQMRSLTETGYVAPAVTELDYATVALPGGRSAATRAAADALNARVDGCDDLYGARPGGFERTRRPAADVPAEIAAELRRLDPGEVSTGLVRPAAEGGEALVWLMLCARTTEPPEGGREEVEARLRQQRLVGYAEGYLEELRSDAIITYAEGL